MKPVLLLILVIFFMLFQSHIDGQSYYQVNKDSLIYFHEKGDLVSFFSKIGLSVRQSAKAKDKSSIDSLGQYLLHDYGDLNPDEKRAIRQAGMQLGFVYRNPLGDYQRSLQYYLIAHHYAPDLSVLDDLAWYIENEISSIYTRYGDYEQAEYFSRMVEKSLQHSIKTMSPATPFVERLSRLYTNFGIKFKSEGNNDEAVIYFNKGYHLADSINYPAGIHPNALGLAEVYLTTENFELSWQFLEIAKRTIYTYENTSDFKERKADLLFREAQFNLEKGIWEKNHQIISNSVPLFIAAIDTLRDYNPGKRREFSKYYTPLAHAYMELDSLERADEAIHQGLSNIIADYNDFENPPEPSQLYHENSFIELFRLQSILFQKQYAHSRDINFLKQAANSIKLGLLANDIIRNEVIADPSKLISIRDNKILTNEGLKILYTLYSLEPDQEYLFEARELFNRSKALLLDEKMKRHLLVNRISIDDSITLVQLQSDMRQLHEEKFVEGINTDSLNGLILSCQKQLDNIYIRYKEVKLPLDQHKNYIEYSIHDDDIYVLSSINENRQFLKLDGKGNFMGLLDRMNDFIGLRGLSDDSLIQRDLYEFLIAPVTTGLPERIVIIPDGEIGFVPFDMLEDRNSKTLLDNCTVSYAYEYEFYKSNHIKTDHKFEIYCLAPTYQKVEGNGKEVTRGSFYNLPYAKIEVDSIRTLFRMGALVSKSGNKDSLISDLKQAGIFHFAGHAIIRKDDAILVLNSDGENKNQLTDQEISLLYPAPDLVVLSACETGLGKLEMGEGIKSLGRSFIESGASSIIISLWNVNDKSTALIMAAFYRYLLQGLAKDESLRKAKLEYISKVEKKYRHPYFWAAFIPAGDMAALTN